MAVDSATLQHLGRLARLDVSALDEARLVKDLGGVLNLVDRLAAAPCAQPTAAAAPACLRPDEALPPADREAFLAAAPRTSLGYFLVPRVIE